MTDVVSPSTRSRMMANIGSKNTSPEKCIRSLLHQEGFRFKLHVNKLPGKPDIVLPKYNSVIFVNGCFWHRHNCHLFRLPKTRSIFWEEKLNKNSESDRHNIDLLLEAGWRVGIVWECSMKGKLKLPEKVLIEMISSWLHSEVTFLQVTCSHE